MADQKPHQLWVIRDGKILKGYLSPTGNVILTVESDTSGPKPSKKMQTLLQAIAEMNIIDK